MLLGKSDPLATQNFEEACRRDAVTCEALQAHATKTFECHVLMVLFRYECHHAIAYVSGENKDQLPSCGGFCIACCI